eukprot:m.72673 g.72673  ORF g.72673 m.72673 type:complete len:990 (+) comp8796_c0_seq1:170-3139(+)
MSMRRYHPYMRQWCLTVVGLSTACRAHDTGKSAGAYDIAVDPAHTDGHRNDVPPSTTHIFYVSPTVPPNGLPPGTQGHPFSTLTQALDAVAAVSDNGTVPATILLDCAPNTSVHTVASTVVLDARHNHLTMARYRSDGMPVGAADRAIVSGGVVLQGQWMPPSDAVMSTGPASASLAWTLNLSAAVKAGRVPTTFNQLFVDTKRAVRAREPEIGSYFRMQEAAPVGFFYANHDLDVLASVAPAQPLHSVEAVVYDSWMASRRNIAAVNVEDKTLTLTAPCRVTIEPDANSGSRYYVENFAAACDSPTEWFWDTATHVLHYVPPDNGPLPTASTFVASAVSGNLFVINGTRDVSVTGVSFQHADWSISPTNTSSGNVQAASFLDSAAVHAVGAIDLSMTDCDVMHVGEYGIWIEGRSRNVLLDGVWTQDTGAGGLRIGRGKPLSDEPPGATTGNVTVTDCTFVFGSHVYHEGNGILLQHASNNTIQRTEVAHHNHCGINVGWTWDYSPSAANHNIVQDCHVHHLGNGDLSDLGGIYLLGISPGTVVRGNAVHDSNPYFTYGHGVYLDQASSDISVVGNALWHTSYSAANQHFGHNNTWTNNAVGLTFAGLGVLSQMNYQASEFGPSDLTFHHNLVLVQGPSPIFVSPYNGTWYGDYNLYWNMSSPGSLSPSFPSDPTGQACTGMSRTRGGCAANASLDQWRASSGQDMHSLVTDPKLTGNPQQGDFSVAPNSPLLTQLGMVPIAATPASTGPMATKQRPWNPCAALDAQATTCGPPPQLVNGTVTGSTQWACGDTVVYQCLPGFAMPPNGSTWRRCGADGAWSGTLPTCVPASGPASWLPESRQLYSGNSIVSNASFLIQQGDGNLCLYAGSPSNNQGELWCSGAQHSTAVYTVVQPDGNMCTRDLASNAPIWCSKSNQTGCGLGRPPKKAHRIKGQTLAEHLAAATAAARQSDNCTFFAMVEPERICIHRGSSPAYDLGTIWCRPEAFV